MGGGGEGEGRNHLNTTEHYGDQANSIVTQPKASNTQVDP